MAGVGEGVWIGVNQTSNTCNHGLVSNLEVRRRVSEEKYCSL